MKKPLLTYEICYDAGTDAGNASMRKAGRKKWNQEDFDAYMCEINRLLAIMGDSCKFNRCGEDRDGDPYIKMTF